MIITAKECGEIPSGKVKALRVAALGFLARYGELFRLGCCCLSSTVQPFAYVVANYACYNGDKKCGENFFHRGHLLSAGGSTALLV